MEGENKTMMNMKKRSEITKIEKKRKEQKRTEKNRKRTEKNRKEERKG